MDRVNLLIVETIEKHAHSHTFQQIMDIQKLFMKQHQQHQRLSSDENYYQEWCACMYACALCLQFYWILNV